MIFYSCVSPDLQLLLEWYELCGEGLVMHEEEIDVSGIVDEESFVAGGHHVASLLIGAKTNLNRRWGQLCS